MISTLTFTHKPPPPNPSKPGHHPPQSTAAYNIFANTMQSANAPVQDSAKPYSSRPPRSSGKPPKITKDFSERHYTKRIPKKKFRASRQIPLQPASAEEIDNLGGIPRNTNHRYKPSAADAFEGITDPHLKFYVLKHLKKEQANVFHQNQVARDKSRRAQRYQKAAWECLCANDPK